MNLLRKLIGQDERFFDLLEASAGEASHTTSLVGKLLDQAAAGKPLDAMDDLAGSRLRDKCISNDIYEALSRSFVTPIEREDMQALTRAIYRVPKTVEKLAERIAIAPGQLPFDIIRQQAAAAEKASSIVSTMVSTLRRGPDLARGRELSDQLQAIENEADKVLVAQLTELYRANRPTGEMFALRDIYDLCEKIIDRCRDAGNVIIMIILKNA
jgi:uncharacterized protein Yka (UPF0111/DUF47 family)